MARVGGRAMFPARFQLVATMNLCPCGARGDPAAECTCSPQRLAAFRDKLSRALLDRFDLVVTVPRPRAEELAGGAGGGLRARCAHASSAARERLRASLGARTDAGGRAARPRGRAVAALGARASARRPRRAHDRRAGGSGCACAPEHVAEALAYRAPQELAGDERAGAGGVRGRDRRARRRRAARRALRALPGRRSTSAAELERLRERGLRFVGRSRAGFPPLLRAIHDPPPGLFLRGAGGLELLAQPAVAIVGARACSPYGAQVARMLGRELAAAGLVVVSGLARGIDGEAHRGALEAGGTTVAVLGCGIDRDYPASHARSRAEIAERGLIVSEYAPGVEPAPWRFPARNRIVAGLCARDGRRRGARAERRADHGRLRARGGARGLRRARRDHVARSRPARTRCSGWARRR